MWLRHGLRVLLWLTIGASGALLVLLSMAALWIMVGGLLADAAERIQLLLMCVQAVALMGVMALAVRQNASKRSPRWLWFVLCAAEALATAASLTMLEDAGTETVGLAVSPLICAAVMAGLCMLLRTRRMNRTEE